MRGVSHAFRELADALEAVETGATDDPGYDLTKIAPVTENLTATDTVELLLEIQFPFLDATPTGPTIELAPHAVHLADDGSLHVTFQATVRTKATDGAHPPAEAPSPPNPDESGAAAARSSPEATTTSSDPAKPPTHATRADSPATTAPPAYRDPEQLRAVYEAYDTFAEMTDALDVDVTPQTVRRHMIKYGIHTPLGTGSRTVQTLLDSDPEAVPPATDDEPTAAAPAAPRTTEAAGGGGRDGDPDSDVDSQLPEPPGETHEQETQRRTEPSAGAEAAADATFEVKVDAALPDRLTLDDVIATVQEAQTLYQVQQQLDLNREAARQLLQDLNLLDLVHGRVATRDLVDRTMDEINQRLQSTVHHESAGS